MTGRVCGLWTVVSLSERMASSGACWNCICKCGTERSVKGCDLRTGRSEGCGCARRTSPWLTTDPDYATKMCRRLRESNPDKYKAIGRRSGYRKRFNLEVEQVEGMLADQDGKCAICFEGTVLGGRSGAKVDHDHDSGQVRGILCNTCNMALGLFYDDVTVLASAIDYLREANRKRLRIA